MTQREQPERAIACEGNRRRHAPIMQYILIYLVDMNLLPKPKEIRQTGGKYLLADDKRIIISTPHPLELFFTARRLQTILRAYAEMNWEIAASHVGAPENVGVELIVDASAIHHTQGYQLSITPERIKIIGGSNAGVFYGVCTLMQLIKTELGGAKKSLPCATINDAPDFAARGVMLDISRDKVPTMQTLFELVDRFAEWKLNELQLYTEHTFAYQNHRVVWQDYSPMTAEQILELDAYCRERFIELVPNQNSLGHLLNWLRHPEYADRAENIDGWDAPWFHYTTPFSLNPSDPRNLDLLREWYDELLPNFTSKMFNVGFDETFDVGQGKSKAEAERIGKGRVYLNFLNKVNAEVRQRGRRMQFWGDVIVNHPELVPELPRDAIALEWGYEANHPFKDHSQLFAKSGVPFYVCPGTSAWNSLIGRTDNTTANLLNAAENGRKNGAVGYLITDWGDYGHWQVLPASYVGFAYGAALSWSLDANRDLDIARALNTHVFDDASGMMGELLMRLGNVYKHAPIIHNSNAVVQNVYSLTVGGPFAKGVALTIQQIRAMRKAIDTAMRPIHKNKMQCADAKQITAEVEWAADMLRHLCDFALYQKKPTRATAKKLASELRGLMRRHRALWLKRNRIGGLRDSLDRFDKVLKFYQSESRKK